MHAPRGPEDRERLLQELLELCFDCHPDPEPLRARLLREPALQALHAEAQRLAALLRSAAAPPAPPLSLPQAAVRAPFWRSPWRRASAVAAAAAVFVGAVLAVHLARVLQNRSARARCQLTVSAPRAVPAGAPWSFTVDSLDLDGNPVASEVRWSLEAADGSVLGPVATTVTGQRTVAVPAGASPPRRLAVAAARAGGEAKQTLDFVASAAAPLVHVTTDKPVYRPGEPVFVRAVALDRLTLQPAAQAAQAMTVRILDPKGAPVFQQADVALASPVPPAPTGVGACTWVVPATAVGGEYALEVEAADGSFPAERLPLVVRSYQPPQLHKQIVLDRKTYAPGAQGSAEVVSSRLGGGPSVGAMVRAALVLDGNEVWSQEAVLDERGRAVFRFVVPETVDKGAARFLARVTDGGVVEAQIEPFVVPTGKVRVAAFPEGGMLVAGVENRVYFEVTDPLGRPIEGAGAITDAADRRVATFVTAHQGRARATFTPAAGESYRVRMAGLEQPLPLPEARPHGIALRASGDGVPAGAPVRVHLAGSGDGPWMVGVFCRGALVGQATARPAPDGSIDQELGVEVPPSAAGVLRVTVFDRRLQPVAERLVRRAAARRLQIALQPAHAAVAPGEAQQVVVRTTDESGAPVAAVVGLSVTDGGALALGDEPRVGLFDQALLFADVERLEDLGDWFVGGEHSERNVDLLLGTRGWRRFVWRNDDAAKQAIAGGGEWARGQLVREGFAQTPQVAGDKAALEAEVLPFARAVADSRARLATSAGLALLLLLGWLAGEGLLAALRWRAAGPRPWLVLAGTAAALLLLAALWLPGARGAAARDRGDRGDFVLAGAAAPVAQLAELPQLRAGGRRGDRQALERDDMYLDADVLRFDPADQRLAWRHLAGYVARYDLVGGAGGGPGLPVREYAHRHAESGARAAELQPGGGDFTETVYWHPLLRTDGRGEATVSFDVSDAVTTWHVCADAHGQGRVGEAEATFLARLPFHVEARLPVEVSAGDRLELPVAVACEDGSAAAALEVTLAGPWSLRGPARSQVKLQDGRGRQLVPVEVGDATGEARVVVVGTAGRFRDQVARAIPVAPRGFPHGRSWGGTVAPQADGKLRVSLPADAVHGSGHLLLRVFPSPLAGLGQGLRSILQEPHGCFEQASSSNYPNVMVLSYLEASGDDVPEVAARARGLLPAGYAQITGYECKQNGYEWFGGDPGHEALTAYGLLQFHDMARVFDVDAGMVQRTQQWLLGRRDGNGGYLRNDRALDSFGRAPQPVTNAYVTYALLRAGVAKGELQREVDALAARAAATDDAYELALAAGALAQAGRPEAGAARRRLLGLQRADGSLRGSTTSITSSGGDDLAVETTAFGLLAWLDDPACAGAVQQAVAYLQTRQTAAGTFGATQATICALQALVAYAGRHRAMPAPGKVAVFVAQRQLAEQPFAAGQAEPVAFDLWPLLPPGEHELRLVLEGGPADGLPWACDLAYHAELPADDPDAKVAIATRLLLPQVEEGRTVALEVTVLNRTDDGQPMTLAVIGLPAGLELPTSVLEDRKRAGDFDLWELQGRSLSLYWRGLAPRAERRVQLDLLARIPGRSTGAASRACLYYTPSQQRWATPLRIEVTAAR